MFTATRRKIEFLFTFLKMQVFVATCTKFFVKYYIGLNKEKVSYLSDLFLPHSRRPSAMFTHPGARFCHTYTRQEGRVARSGHSWSDL